MPAQLSVPPPLQQSCHGRQRVHRTSPAHSIHHILRGSCGHGLAVPIACCTAAAVSCACTLCAGGHATGLEGPFRLPPGLCMHAQAGFAGGAGSKRAGGTGHTQDELAQMDPKRAKRVMANRQVSPPCKP